MLNLHDCVRLNNDRDDPGLKAGVTGTIIDISPDGELGIYYSVEFFDSDHETIEESMWVEFKAEELTKIWDAATESWLPGEAPAKQSRTFSQIIKGA